MKTILVLDDNKFILDVLSISLRTFLKDFTVLTASNGASGVELLKARNIDMILTDLDMPIMDGYTFIEHAREIRPEAPVFAMTGACTPNIEGRLRSLGVRWCIEKPFQIDELTRRISEELDRNTRSPANKAGRSQDFFLRQR
ncbi:MAG TPA: response regulator [Nitrospirota bacterium]